MVTKSLTHVDFPLKVRQIFKRWAGKNCFFPTRTIPYGVLRSAASPGSVGSSVEKLDQKWPPRTIPGFSTDPCYLTSIFYKYTGHTNHTFPFAHKKADCEVGLS